jgi:hypothetical protein
VHERNATGNAPGSATPEAFAGMTVEVLGGQPTLSLQESATTVDVWVDRSNCHLTDRSKAC